MTYEISMVYCADLECWRAVIYRDHAIVAQADGKTQSMAVWRARTRLRVTRGRVSRAS